MKSSHWLHVVGVAITAGSLAVWYATGSEGYTRWPNERLAQADAPPADGESELLADAGFTDNSTQLPRPDIQSRFALGLLPGGPDPRHLLAVATVVAASATASVVVVFGSAVTRRVGRRSSQSMDYRPFSEGDSR